MPVCWQSRLGLLRKAPLNDWVSLKEGFFSRIREKISCFNGLSICTIQVTDLSVCQWRLTKKIQHVFLECEQFKVDRGIFVCCVEMKSTCKVKEMANGIRLSG